MKNRLSKNGIRVGRPPKHDLYGTPEYRSWMRMIFRCENPKYKGWHNYGGRGISVSPLWRNDVAAFVAYVGPKPGPGYSIDRIDNDKGYEPGNVRWATLLEQNRNKRAPKGRRRK